MADMDPDQRTYEFPYSYKALREDEIRILFLNPGTYEEPLMGKLEIFKIWDAPDYDAISYCWGEPIFSHNIYIVGEGVQALTESLFGALRRFRDSSVNVVLWADAICINQKNLNEKSHQVAQMGRIFQSAKTLRVWLGEAIPSDEHSFWALRQLDSFFSNELMVNSDVKRLLTGQHAPCHCAGAHMRDYTLESLTQLLSRPYFRRLWPLQELSSQQKANIYAGRFHIALYIRRAVFAIHWCVRYPADFQTDLGISGTDLCRKFKWLIEQSNIGVSTLQQFPGFELLCHATTLQASEPRDYVYCARGLEAWQPIVELNGVKYGSGKYHGEMDYEIPLEQLWLAISFDILNNNQHRFGKLTENHGKCSTVVLALGGMQRARELGPLPSWAVDFSCLTDEMRSKVDLYRKGIRLFNVSPFKCYRSEHSCFEINVSGRIVGTVSNILEHSNQPSRCDYFDIEVENIVKWYFYCYSYLVSPLSTVKSVDQGRALLPQWNENHAHEILLNYSTKTLGWESTANYSFEQHRTKIHDLLAKGLLSTFEAWIAQTEKVYQHICRIHYTRTFHPRVDNWIPMASLATTDFGTAGWVPPHAVIGDRVCLLQDAATPFIVRKCDPEHYIIVGDAYVYGFKHGFPPHRLQTTKDEHDGEIFEDIPGGDEWRKQFVGSYELLKFK